jgi:pyruvate formate lyase activating enzyme
MSSTSTLQIGAIQRFCLQDGPGIRTTVFLQGCSLRCWWCHNAHLQPHESDDAREIDVDELANELQRDARYWLRSDGGITLSGGEPLEQAQACAVLLTRMKSRGHHCCVETAGAAPLSAIMSLDESVDLWLFDLKTLSAPIFRQATGGDLDQVLANLRELLRRRGETVWLRIPVIRGFNDDTQSFDAMRKFVAQHETPARIQLLPGHNIGEHGSQRGDVDPATCNRAKQILDRAHDRVEVCW